MRKDRALPSDTVRAREEEIPMAGLTSCKVCGGTVAKSAFQCPHCGADRPVAKGVAESKEMLLKLLVFALFFGFWAFFCMGADAGLW